MSTALFFVVVFFLSTILFLVLFIEERLKRIETEEDHDELLHKFQTFIYQMRSASEIDVMIAMVENQQNEQE